MEEGFLTAEQRLVLNEAVQSLEPPKETPSLRRTENSASAKHGGSSARTHHAAVAPKQERRSHAVSNGRPKKGGGGGRGTWGNPLDPNTFAPIDRNDPIYDSDEEKFEVHIPKPSLANSLENYKEKVSSIAEEYFASGEVSTAAEDLKDLGLPAYHHFFVKRLISLALDRHDREREMASSLLSDFYVAVIQPDHFAKGFTQLIETVDDLQLDCPNAPNYLSLFIARAIVDDVLPPSFLARTRRSLHDESLGLTVLDKTENHLRSPHHAERVERCWGGSAYNTVDGTKKKIVHLLEEYVNGGDMPEALRCIRDLNLPFFHHEVVKRALILAMENAASNNTRTSSLLSMLHECADEGLITISQMSKGFSRVADSVDDLSLDVPNARELLHSFISKATSEGWLDSNFAKTVSEEISASELVTTEADSKLFRDLKRTYEVIITEYFASGDLSEVEKGLEEAAYPDLLHLFVKKLITLAMDRKNREREMSSVLLSDLYGRSLPSDQIEIGFSRLLKSVEDLALDTPDAAGLLSLFIARAVADEILTPQFLSEAKDTGREGSLASEVVRMASAALNAKHGAERVLRCWGGSAEPTLEDAKRKVDLLLEEYVVGGDIAEASHCIRDLDMPFFHHEIVKRSLILAMEKKTRVLKLLEECGNDGLITSDQMIKGFDRVAENILDLSLDIPNALDSFKELVEQAKKEGWLSSSYTYLIPQPNSEPVVSGSD